MAGWSSGWVEIPNVGFPQVRNFNFTHNLGTSDLVFSVYWYNDIAGSPPTDPISVEDVYVTDNGFQKGARIKILNDNDITLSLMKDGFSEGDWRFAPGAPAYIKVVAISIISDPAPAPAPGGASNWSSGWVAAAGNNTSTPFNHTFNSIDVAWQIYVAEDDQGLNAITMDVQFDYLQNVSDTYGAMLTNITKTSFNLQLGGGYLKDMFNHAELSFAGKYVMVVGVSSGSSPVPGTGDLCKILSEDSGYQMFRNGLTMQWMSSPAFITESSQVVNFPIPFASKPFKVTASTRYPSDDGSSQQWIQVASWNATSVTIRAQSQNVGSWAKPVYADIIAVGIAEVTDCPGSTDPNDPSDPEGIKISELTSAAELKDDDLFVISKENTGDLIYDISQKVTLSQLTTYVKVPTPTFSYDPVTETLNITNA